MHVFFNYFLNISNRQKYTTQLTKCNLKTENNIILMKATETESWTKG